MARLTAASLTCAARRPAALAALALLLGGCAALAPRPAGIGAPLSWSDLPGWNQDRQAEAWPALLANCARMPARDPAWQPLCAAANGLPTPDDAGARAFFETWFEPRAVTNNDGGAEGLITGYYEPLLYGSRVRSGRFRYPLYRRPDDLLTVDLSSLYPELAGRPVRARLDGRRVVPYYSRAEIGGKQPLAGQELLWVDDAVALFMLQVQGSGIVQLPNGERVAVGYADQNGHPYVAIGRKLVERGAIPPEQVTLFTIRDWLQAHPDEAQSVLDSNPSYVFFEMRPRNDGPLGSLNTPLTAARSVAVDPAYVPLGTPLWLDTSLPDDPPAPWRRLMLAQDTGGAIKGAVRADVFFGQGGEAERLAGTMKQTGRVYALVPKPPQTLAQGKGVGR